MKKQNFQEKKYLYVRAEDLTTHSKIGLAVCYFHILYVGVN